MLGMARALCDNVEPDTDVSLLIKHDFLFDLAGYFAGLGWTAETTRRNPRNSGERRNRLLCPTRHANHNNNRSMPMSGLDRRHNCARCGKSYKNAYILKRHMLYECGKAPSFSCPHCAFSSKYERNLKAHINHRHVNLPPVNQRA